MSSRLEISDITVSDNSFSVDGKRFAKGALALDVRPDNQNVGFVTADTLEYVTLPKPYTLYSAAKDEVFTSLSDLTTFFDENLVPPVVHGGGGTTITSTKITANGTDATLSLPAGKSFLAVSAATNGAPCMIKIGTTLGGEDVAKATISAVYPAYGLLFINQRAFNETEDTTLFIGNPAEENIVLRLVFA